MSTERDNPEAPGGDKAVVHRDEVKERHTTHWDMDVLTDDELEQLYKRNRRSSRMRRWGGSLRVVGGAAVLAWLVVLLIWWWGDFFG